MAEEEQGFTGTVVSVSQGRCSAHAGWDPAELSVHLLRASLRPPQRGQRTKLSRSFMG